MAVSAADVKKLRELTDAPMMACKKALDDADGDIEKAADLVRERTGAKMDARAAERTAAEGAVFAHTADGVGALLQLSSETDFVAKGDRFQGLGAKLAELAVTADAGDAAALAATEVDGKTATEVVSEVQAVTGEKLEIARVARFAGHVKTYLHTPTPGVPPKVGVMLNLAADGDVADNDTFNQTAHQICLHIAAAKPQVLAESDVDTALLDKEREFARKEALESGKPDHIVEKIVEGKVGRFYKESVLLNQPFIMDDDKTIAQVVADLGKELDTEISIAEFARFEVG